MSNHVGRIGFLDNQRISIIPVTYVSDGNAIYGHALEGSKVFAMRKYPSVCFQIDNIDNLSNWRSIIVWGLFEEVKSKSTQEKINNLFIDQLGPLSLGETVSTTRVMDQPPLHIQKKSNPVLYKIAISDIAGRFEKS